MAGCIPVWPEDNRILICKRAIEPRRGWWTIPAGFLENGESVEEGAARETLEEANARVKINRLHTVFSIPHINQVYMVYVGTLLDLNFSAGEESLECKLSDVADIPWPEIAFSSIDYTLRRYVEDLKTGNEITHLHSRPADAERLKG